MARNIEFVYYTGEYPNLCSGTLCLKIDGKEETFGYDWGEGNPKHETFWCSGGSVTFDDEWNEEIEQGPWGFDFDRIKELNLTQEEEEIIEKLFNENVPQGCCGGCV